MVAGEGGFELQGGIEQMKGRTKSVPNYVLPAKQHLSVAR
jgi:hypothetical protein